MTPKDDLFRLVKSLSPAEKRYFKLFASTYGGEKKYTALFDAIDAQVSYDEAALKEKFRDERFVRQLTAAKRYLYDQILRSLRHCHEQGDVHAQVRTLLQNVEVLYHKGLRDQARTALETARQLALDHEDFVGQLELTTWIERLDPVLASTGGGIEAVSGEYRAVLDRIRNYVDIGVAARRVALPMLADQLRTVEDLEILETEIVQFPEVDLSVRASMIRCAAMATYHFARCEYRDALVHVDRQMDILEEHPRMIDTDPIGYVRAIGNRLVLLRRIGSFEEFLRTLESMRSRSQEILINRRLWSRRLRAEFFSVFFLNQANFALARNRTESYAELIDQGRSGIQEHRPFLRPHVITKLYSSLTLLYFSLGNLDNALRMNERVAAGPRPDRGWETFDHARLVRLVLQFDKGNFDLVESLVISTQRYFKRLNLVHGFEGIILEFFRKAIRCKPGNEALRALLIDTRERLLPLQEDPLETSAFRHFPYLTWFERRIAGLADCRITGVSGDRSNTRPFVDS